MSPIRSVTRALVANETPTAVLTTPSIPLVPRFECTVTPEVVVPNHSTSRIGIDDDTTKWDPTVIADVTVLAIDGSLKFSDVQSDITCCAATSALDQLVSQDLSQAVATDASVRVAESTSPMSVN